jgi:hypothetical protein
MSNYGGIGAGEVPFRFQWTFPVLISPHDPTTLHVASQYVHRSTDEGASWTRISPDLTAHAPATLGRTGGPIHGEMTGAEWYATIYALAESPRAKGVLWAGSDDGLIHVSRDGGGTWANVTPPGYGKFTRTAGIEASPHDAGTAYVAANRYQQDDFRPYLWKTTDYGRTWTPIVSGIPVGAYARTIREDPVRRGLLYTGTEIGVYVSFDDGRRWEPLQLNLPRSSVRDLRVHGVDLVAATHGRSFWLLDDVSLLRQIADSVTSRPAFLFQPATAVRWASGGAPSLTAGQNPRGGAVVDYYLRSAARTRVTLEFLDGAGAVIRTFTSDSLPADSARTPADSLRRLARASMRDSVVYEPADSVVAARAGTNRFVWDLRAPGAKRMRNTLIDLGTLAGPVVPPGPYAARLVVGRDTLVRRFAVAADPRVATPAAELARQFALASGVRDRIADVVDGATRIEDLRGSSTSAWRRRRASRTRRACRTRRRPCARSSRRSRGAVRGALPRGPVHPRPAGEALQPADHDERAGADRRLRAHEAARRDVRRLLEPGGRAAPPAAGARGRRAGHAQPAAHRAAAARRVRAAAEGSDDCHVIVVGPSRRGAGARVRSGERRPAAAMLPCRGALRRTVDGPAARRLRRCVRWRVR